MGVRSTMATFQDLPLEISIEICSYLSFPDLRHARLSFNCMRTPASKELFRTVLVLVSRDSFEKLKAISMHKELRLCVRALRYSGRMLMNQGCVENFTFWRNSGIGTGISFSETPDEGEVARRIIASLINVQLKQHHKKYCEHWAAQQSVLEGDAHADLLIDAFKRLPYLASVSYDRPLYNKLIDGPFDMNAMSTIARQVLMEPIAAASDLYQGRQFFALLKAVQQAGGADLKSLRGTGLELARFNDNIANDTEVLKHINKLHHVTLHFNYGYHKQNAANRVSSLIRGSPYLQSLQLSFQFTTFQRTELVIRLSDLLGKQTHWPYLKILKLQAFATSQETLTDFLGAHASTLRSLELGHVDLRPAPGHEESHVGSWISIIQFLQRKLQLSRVKFHGNLSNRFNEGWVTYDETAAYHKRLKRGVPALKSSYAKDCLRYRIENFILGSGDCPFVARNTEKVRSLDLDVNNESGHLESVPDEDDDENEEDEQDPENDGLDEDTPVAMDYHGLNWIWAEDESWHFEDRLLF